MAYECIVCGNPRTVWKCTHCESNEHLKKSNTTSSNSSSSGGGNSNIDPFEGLWYFTGKWVYVSQIIATTITYWLWFQILEMDLHGSIIYVLFKILILFVTWAIFYVFWSQLLTSAILITIGYYILNFLTTTMI